MGGCHVYNFCDHSLAVCIMTEYFDKDDIDGMNERTAHLSRAAALRVFALFQALVTVLLRAVP